MTGLLTRWRAYKALGSLDKLNKARTRYYNSLTKQAESAPTDGTDYKSLLSGALREVTRLRQENQRLRASLEQRESK